MTWEEIVAKLMKYKDGAILSGEMQGDAHSITEGVTVDSIPLSPSVNYAELVDGDDSPMEVVVEIPVSKSKRAWQYTPEVIKSIVKQVQESTTAGFKGHQRAEDVATEFPDPVTHWIGATYDENKQSGFFRGYVDPKDSNLRRWIKTGRIKEVSIFGRMQTTRVAGEVHVTDCDLLSIDWTPLGRPGMPTKLIDMKIKGEMEDTEMTTEELLAKLKEMLEAGEITPDQMAEMLPEDPGEDEEVEEPLDPAIVARLAEQGIIAKSSEEALAAVLEKMSNPGTETPEQIAARVADAKYKGFDAVSTLVQEMFSPAGTTEAEIAGEMDAFVARPQISKVIDSFLVDTGAQGARGARGASADNKFTKTTRRAIGN